MNTTTKKVNTGKLGLSIHAATAVVHIKHATAKNWDAGYMRGRKLLACTFADYFVDVEDDFDPDAFFLACGLSAFFIKRMAKARTAHARKNNQPGSMN